MWKYHHIIHIKKILLFWAALAGSSHFVWNLHLRFLRGKKNVWTRPWLSLLNTGIYLIRRFVLFFGTLVVYFYEGCESVLTGWDQGQDEVVWPQIISIEPSCVRAKITINVKRNFKLYLSSLLFHKEIKM